MPAGVHGLAGFDTRSRPVSKELAGKLSSILSPVESLRRMQGELHGPSGSTPGCSKRAKADVSPLIVAAGQGFERWGRMRRELHRSPVRIRAAPTQRGSSSVGRATFLHRLSPPIARI